MGRLAARIATERRAQVERNLRRVDPTLSDAELGRLVRETFESYARYYEESFRLPGTSAADLDAGFTHEGYEHIEAALAAGNGAIMAMPHLGGWEWSGFWLTQVKGLPVTAVVEQLDPPELFEWFVELRRSFGFEVVALGPEAGTATARALKANHTLALLCDRDLRGTGPEVEFFGERTTLPGGPATLALRTGAHLLPAAIYFDGPDSRHAVVLPPLDTTRQGRLRDDVQRVTQDLAAALEGLIRRAPEQWHLLQPNWPSDHTS
jgi:KDO2-lipid IV(A) lauroyltransferase